MLFANELQERYHKMNAAKKITITIHDNGGAAMTIMITATHAARFLNRASFLFVNSDKGRIASNSAAPEYSDSPEMKYSRTGFTPESHQYAGVPGVGGFRCPEEER